MVTMALSRDLISCECRDLEIPRSEVTRGHWKWYHSKGWVCFSISVL